MELFSCYWAIPAVAQLQLHAVYVNEKSYFDFFYSKSTSHNPSNFNSSLRDLNRKQWFSIQKMQFLGRRKMDKEVLPSHLRKDSDRGSSSFWELIELSENLPTTLPRHFSQTLPSWYSTQDIFKGLLIQGQCAVQCGGMGEIETNKVLENFAAFEWNET